MTESISISIPEYALNTFEGRLSKINKRLAKIKGTTPVTVISTVEKEVKTGENVFGEPKFETFLDMELSLPETTKHLGFTYKGTISIKDGIPTIFSVDPDKSLTHIEEMRCDHCGYNRKRNSVYVFNKDDGTEVVIGATCANEFFGIKVKEILTMFYTFISDINEESCNGGGGRGFRGYDMNELIRVTLVEYGHNSFYVKKDPYGDDYYGQDDNWKEPTTSKVSGLLFAIHNPNKTSEYKKSIEQYVEDARKVASIDEVKELLIKYYGGLDPKENNFNFNVVNALFLNNEKELRKAIPYKVMGMVVWAIFNALNKEGQSEKKEKKINAYIGNVGDKITVSGKVALVRSCGSYAYNGPTSLLIAIDTPEGQCKTFTTSKTLTDVEQGDEVTVTGSVKSHEDYKGFKSTMLTRCKRI